jgi:lipopolysaccharide/colanic/teichoic acid biosynthesis glycosyltransferase
MKTIKRLVDLVVSFCGLILLAPLLATCAVSIRLAMGPPTLFQQIRAGRNGSPFALYKFRTMTDEKDATGRLLPDDHRLTRIGRFLRRSSIDELPQLWNVVRGEMSLVGPRPLFIQYVKRYSPRERRRLEVTPGITGWAQANGRNSLPWSRKFELDVWYVDHWSLGLDFWILALTVIRVLRGCGISEGHHPTMTEFLGTTIDG